MDVEQLFIKPEEAATILGVNKRTVVAMIKNGKLRAKDLNASGKGIRHRWVVLKEDVLITNHGTSQQHSSE